VLGVTSSILKRKRTLRFGARSVYNTTRSQQIENLDDTGSTAESPIQNKKNNKLLNFFKGNGRTLSVIIIGMIIIDILVWWLMIDSKAVQSLPSLPLPPPPPSRPPLLPPKPPKINEMIVDYSGVYDYEKQIICTPENGIYYCRNTNSKLETPSISTLTKPEDTIVTGNDLILNENIIERLREWVIEDTTSKRELIQAQEILTNKIKIIETEEFINAAKQLSKDIVAGTISTVSATNKLLGKTTSVISSGEVRRQEFTNICNWVKKERSVLLAVGGAQAEGLAGQLLEKSDELISATLINSVYEDYLRQPCEMNEAFTDKLNTLTYQTLEKIKEHTIDALATSAGVQKETIKQGTSIITSFHLFWKGQWGQAATLAAPVVGKYAIEGAKMAGKAGINYIAGAPVLFGKKVKKVKLGVLLRDINYLKSVQ